MNELERQPVEEAMSRKFLIVLAIAVLILTSAIPTQAASTTLIIVAFGYAPSKTVEWVQIKNISGGSINLSDYALGDEENPNESEGMRMLPNVDLADGATFTVRVRNDGAWPYTVPDPTYCLNSCTGSYTNLSSYTDWFVGSAGTVNLANAADHVILTKTNGGIGDGRSDDELVDAVCWGTGSGADDFVDLDADLTSDPGEDIFTTDGCLTDIASGGYRRANTNTDTDAKTDWENNPNRIALRSFRAVEAASVNPLAVVLPVLGLVVLGGGLLWARRRRLA